MPRIPTRYLSPLRYPGGKGRLAKFVRALLESQSPRPTRYVEPFAGGAGVGLRLLVDELVDEIVLNDLNPGIAAFWRAVFASPAELLARLEACSVNVEEWHAQRAIYLAEPEDDVDLGFAFFFLNRTNRSGIPDGRPIGGYEQTGPWKIDARFDKAGLANRIEALSSFATRVTVCQADGIGLIEHYLNDPAAVIYADPPYLGKGDGLYLDTLDWDDHLRLACLLKAGGRWLVTYDADSRVTQDLYAGLRCAEFTLSHSAAVQHVGREYAVFAPSLAIPSLEGLGGKAAFIRSV
jgi:DNA adenine methylase